MVESNEIVLYQYGPDPKFVNLPTGDPDCLAVQAYLKFSGVPFTTHNITDPSVSPEKTLPLLILGQGITVFKSSIQSKLIEIGYNLNSKFSNEIRLDIFVWSCFIQENLTKSQLYYWWYDEENYQAVTKHYYLPRSYSWPFTVLDLNSRRKLIKSKLNLDGVNTEDIANHWAQKTYSSLSLKLGQNKYFYGSEPSSFDALVFGHLAVQLSGDFPKKLSYLLTEFPNLIDFVSRIMENYFSCELINIDYTKVQNWFEEVNLQRESEIEEYELRLLKPKANLAFVALVSSCALFLIASNFFPYSLFYKYGEPAHGSFFRYQFLDNSTKATSKKSYNFILGNNPTIIEDDAKCYDWDEQYLEKMGSGIDLPDSNDNLGEMDD